MELGTENGDGENEYDNEKEDFHEDIENNYMMDKETGEPHSEAQEAQKETSGYFDNFRDDRSSTTIKNGQRSQRGNLDNTDQNPFGQRDAIQSSDKGRLLKKMGQKQKRPSKNIESSKIGRGLNNIYKKNIGKQSRKSSYVSGTSIFPISQEPSKRKYTKVQVFKTYAELVQIMQNMGKFDWIEAAGILNKSQLGKRTYDLY